MGSEHTTEELRRRLTEAQSLIAGLREQEQRLSDEIRRREAEGETPEVRRANIRRWTRDLGLGIAGPALVAWRWVGEHPIRSVAMAAIGIALAVAGAIFVAPDSPERLPRMLGPPSPVMPGTLPPPIVSDSPTATPSPTVEASPTTTPAPEATSADPLAAPDPAPSGPPDAPAQPTGTPQPSPGPTVTPPPPQPTAPPTREPTPGPTTTRPPAPSPTTGPTPRPTVTVDPPEPPETPQPTPTRPPEIPREPTLEVCLRLPVLVRELCLGLL